MDHGQFSSAAGYSGAGYYDTPVSLKNDQQDFLNDAKQPYGYQNNQGIQAPRPTRERPIPDEPVTPPQENKKGGKAWLPILAIILVFGLLLAAVCVPEWENKTGKLAETLAPVKAAITELADKVLGDVLSLKAKVESFEISDVSSMEAPSTVRFTAVTSTKTTGLTIVDSNQRVIYDGKYVAELGSTDVMANSKQLIWTPSYVEEEGYTGTYTAYAVGKDGIRGEGVTAAAAVNVGTPKPEVPAMQGFTCDIGEGDLPVDITFTMMTNTDVEAVRVADESGAAVAVLYESSANTGRSSMVDNGTDRVWSVTITADTPYHGMYYAQYLLSGDLSFRESNFSWDAKIGEIEIESEATPDPFEALIASVDEGVEETPEPTPEPTPIPTPTNTPEPTPEPTPTPSPTPANTPFPAMEAQADESADPAKLGLQATLYSNGKKLTKEYTRSNEIHLLSGSVTEDGGNDYSAWRQAGILTFRGSGLRQNAAYGTVEVDQLEKLELVWTKPIGSMNISDGSAGGVNAPGQPLIVKWPKQTRSYMNLNDTAMNTTALKEVMMACQNGKIYFWNLLTGEETRNAIDIGAPSRGGLSLATNGLPMLGVGQYNAKLPNKTVKNGYHLFSLVNGEELSLIRCDNDDRNSNYTGVNGAAVFDAMTGSLVFGSLNGVLYVAEPGNIHDTFNKTNTSVKIASTYQGYKTLATNQKKTVTNINGSVAMYNHYAYYGDQFGVVQCVDINTLKPVWAVCLDDTVESTPALDIQGEEISLYIGNAVETDKTRSCDFNCYDALTGALKWSYSVPETGYQKKKEIGIYASPVIGENKISDLVIFTVTKDEKATVTALNKESGTLVWQYDLAATTVSSPVAVYNTNGDAWLVQADSDGCLYLLDALTGSLRHTLQLKNVDEQTNLSLKASPAVYGNLMVIGTMTKQGGAVYCVRIGPEKGE